MNVRPFFRDNWPLKFGAFLLGIALWVHVKTEQRYQHVVSFPLIVNEASGRFVVANEIPSAVNVRVVGSGKDLLFGSNHGRVVLRPRVNRRDALTYEIGVENVEGLEPDDDIAVVDIESPRSVVLDFDFLDTREAIVIPRIRVDLAAGHTLVEAIHADPPTVRIAGPRRYIRGMRTVETDSVVAANAIDDISIHARIALPRNRNLTSTPGEVVLRADVQALLERRIRDVPIVVTHAPREVVARAVPEAATIDLIGGDDVVGRLDTSAISVELDYRDRFEIGLDDLPLSVNLPTGVRLLRVNPETASLIVTEQAGVDTTNAAVETRERAPE